MRLRVFFGPPKLLNAVAYPDFKLPRSPIVVVRETVVTAMFDGDNNTGMIARAGLVLIHTVAAPPAVAPFGGA